MNEQEIEIWGRKFNLAVVYDCYKGEEVLDSQKEALNEFLQSGSEFDLCLDKVKQYCKENDGQNSAAEIDDIFQLVTPKSIFIKRTKDRIAALMCDFKFDPEHGLAVVFKNGKFFDIGSEDIIL